MLFLYLLKVNSIQIHYQERHSLITLRQLLIRLGYNENKFCGHSFRIGASTSADAAGVEDHVIQTLGRWFSDCYLRYIRTDKNVICKVQEKMCLF